MINVLVIESPLANAVTWWRLFRPFAQMRKMYPGKFNFKFTRKLTAEDLYLTDVFILSRPNDKETLEVVKRVKDVGRSKIILDIDDAMTNLPIYHDQAAYHHSRAHIAREIWTYVDHFWVSTEQLLYECDCLTKGEIIPNAIMPNDLPLEAAPDRGLWMWRGRGMQKEDVYQAGREVYDKIKHIPNRFVFWGVLPALNHGRNIHLEEYDDDVQSYMAKLKQARFNVVWKPLVDCQFNDAKSNISWIEATMSGGVCLTNYAGKKAWEHATAEPLEYDAAVDLWEKSRDRILQDFNLENTARQRMESIYSILDNVHRV